MGLKRKIIVMSSFIRPWNFFPNFQKMKVMQSKNKLDTSNKFFCCAAEMQNSLSCNFLVTNWCKLTKGSIFIQKYVYGTKKQLSKKKKRKSPFFIVSRFRSERKWKKILQQKNFVVRKKIAFEKNFWARRKKASKKCSSSKMLNIQFYMLRGTQLSGRSCASRSRGHGFECSGLFLLWLRVHYQFLSWYESFKIVSFLYSLGALGAFFTNSA